VPCAKFGAFVRHVTKIPLSHPTIIADRTNGRAYGTVSVCRSL